MLNFHLEKLERLLWGQRAQGCGKKGEGKNKDKEGKASHGQLGWVDGSGMRLYFNNSRIAGTSTPSTSGATRLTRPVS